MLKCKQKFKCISELTWWLWNRALVFNSYSNWCQFFGKNYKDFATIC